MRWRYKIHISTERDKRRSNGVISLGGGKGNTYGFGGLEVLGGARTN